MIGIIGAMDKEIEILLSQMTILKKDTFADKVFFVGKLAGKEVVVAKSGIGKVNAAMTTTLLLEKYNIDVVLNIGLAGGIFPARIGDLILADGISYFDVDLTMIDEVPFGQMGSDPLIIETDFNLRQKAIYIFEDYNILFHVGKIVSGDQFVSSIDYLKPILSVLDNVLACEMEGMAIGLTCFKFHIPFLSIRGISDIINASNQKETYKDLSEQIAHDTSEFVIRFLEVFDE